MALARSAAIRIAHPAVMAFALAFAIANVYLLVTAGDFAWDIDAYWDAAMRVRAGENLYVPYGDVNADEVYRYAPWFAWMWVPLTFLPRGVVDVVWSGAMLICSFVAVAPIVRTRTEAGIAFALIAWTMLAYVSVGGNVHAAMMVVLVLGLGTRWGPVAIAVAASLKAVPLLLALVYLGRREWGKLAATLALTAVLTVPMLFYGIDDYTTDAGGATLLTGPAWFVAVGLASVATIVLGATRYGWLAGATAVAVAFPRFLVYDVSVLLAGLPLAARAREASVGQVGAGGTDSHGHPGQSGAGSASSAQAALSGRSRTDEGW